MSKEVKVLTKDEQKRLEEVIENENTDNDIGILLCLYTGIRIGELCALRWENINLDRRIITINKTMYRISENSGKSKTKIIFSTPKSANSERDIPIASFLVNKLLIMKKDEGFVINNKGKLTERAIYSRRYNQLLKKSGI